MANSTNSPPPPPPHAPPPLAKDAVLNLQLHYLVSNFSMQLGQLLQLPADPNRAAATVDATIERLAKHPSFGCVAASLSQGTTTAAILRGLATASARATALTRQNAPSTLQPANNAENTLHAEAPYLRAATTPPRRVNRLPPIPVTTTDQDQTPRTRDVVLTRQALNRASRIAARFIGHENHIATRITSNSPMRGPHFFRSALREGGMLEPIVVIPTDSPMVLFAIAQPGHIAQIQPHYERYCNLLRNRVRNLPTITLSQPNTLAHFASSLDELSQLYRHCVTEVLRLSSLRDKFPAAPYFARSLCTMLDGIANKIASENPDHTFVKEHTDTAEDRARMIQLLLPNATRRADNQDTVYPHNFQSAAEALAENARARDGIRTDADGTLPQAPNPNSNTSNEATVMVPSSE